MRRHTVNRYRPDYVTPPGYFIDEKLREIGMTGTVLAGRIQTTPRDLAAILDGQVPVTPAMALHLERVLGIPAHFWTNAERAYRESLARAIGGCSMLRAGEGDRHRRRTTPPSSIVDPRIQTTH
jgi:addiction module HigA family antidote